MKAAWCWAHSLPQLFDKSCDGVVHHLQVVAKAQLKSKGTGGLCKVAAVGMAPWFCPPQPLTTAALQHALPHGYMCVR